MKDFCIDTIKEFNKAINNILFEEDLDIDSEKKDSDGLEVPEGTDENQDNSGNDDKNNDPMVPDPNETNDEDETTPHENELLSNSEDDLEEQEINTNAKTFLGVDESGNMTAIDPNIADADPGIKALNMLISEDIKEHPDELFEYVNVFFTQIGLNDIEDARFRKNMPEVWDKLKELCDMNPREALNNFTQFSKNLIRRGKE